jgi:hypothetical protein
MQHLSDDERVDLESEQSMAASDPPSITQPGLDNEPVVSSAYMAPPYDKRDPVDYFDCGEEVDYHDCGGDGEQYPEEESWLIRLVMSLFSVFTGFIDKIINFFRR